MDLVVNRVRGWRFVSWVDQAYAFLLEVESNNLDYLYQDDYIQKRFKHDQTTTVALTRIDDQSFVIKRYNARNRWHKIKRALRRSRARRCWQMSQQFNQAGLNVASVVLMQERRWGPLCGDAYFINQHLDGDTLLDALPKMEIEQQQRVKQAVLEAFSLMRKHRITHGDMKASNLMWFQEKLFFIDLDAAQQHRTNLSWRWSYKKDLKRFLKNWLGQADLMALFDDIG